MWTLWVLVCTGAHGWTRHVVGRGGEREQERRTLKVDDGFTCVSASNVSGS